MPFIVIVEVFLVMLTALAVIKGNKTLSYLSNVQNLIRTIICMFGIALSIQLKIMSPNFFLGVCITIFSLTLLLVGVMRFNIKEAIFSTIFTSTWVFIGDIIIYVTMILIEGGYEKEMSYMYYSKLLHAIFIYPMLRIDLRALQALMSIRWSDLDKRLKKRVLGSFLCLLFSATIILIDFSFMFGGQSLTINILLCVSAFVLLITSIVNLFITRRSATDLGQHEYIVRELNVLEKFYGMEHYFDLELAGCKDLQHAKKVLNLLELWCKQNLSITANFFNTFERLTVVLILDNIKELSEKQIQELGQLNEVYQFDGKRDRLTNTFLIKLKIKDVME